MKQNTCKLICKHFFFSLVGGVLRIPKTLWPNITSPCVPRVAKQEEHINMKSCVLLREHKKTNLKPIITISECQFQGCCGGQELLPCS